VYLPVANDTLGTAPLGWRTWVLLAPFPVVVWGVDEVFRWWRRRTHRGDGAALVASA
jgi:hypothetical protein